MGQKQDRTVETDALRDEGLHVHDPSSRPSSPFSAFLAGLPDSKKNPERTSELQNLKELETLTGLQGFENRQENKKYERKKKRKHAFTTPTLQVLLSDDEKAEAEGEIEFISLTKWF